MESTEVADGFWAGSCNSTCISWLELKTRARAGKPLREVNLCVALFQQFFQEVREGQLSGPCRRKMGLRWGPNEAAQNRDEWTRDLCRVNSNQSRRCSSTAATIGRSLLVSRQIPGIPGLHIGFQGFSGFRMARSKGWGSPDQSRA